LHGIANITRKQEDVPNMVALNQIDNFWRRIGSPEANHQQLANLLFQRHVIDVVVQVFTLTLCLVAC
jgi:hypothetical protein